jgi:hypothetical protein
LRPEPETSTSAKPASRNLSATISLEAKLVSVPSLMVVR